MIKFSQYLGKVWSVVLDHSVRPPAMSLISTATPPKKESDWLFSLRTASWESLPRRHTTHTRMGACIECLFSNHDNWSRQCALVSPSKQRRG